MDINQYSQVMSNVNSINASVVNAQNTAAAAKAKLQETIGDITTGEGIKEAISKVISPMASGALKKVGVTAADIEDIKAGKLSRIALRRLQQKLGTKTPEEFLRDKAKAIQDRLQREADKVTAPVRNRGGEEVENQEDATPGQAVEEPEVKVDNGIDADIEDEEDDDDFPIVNSTEAGEDLFSSLDNPLSFKNFIKDQVPEFADSSDDIFEGARTELNTLAKLDFTVPKGQISLSGGETSLDKDPTPSQYANTGNLPEDIPSNIPEGARLLDPEVDDDFSLQTTTPISGGVENYINRPPESQQTGAQPATNESTGGNSNPLQDEQGNSVESSATQNTGASSGSGDSSLSNSTKTAIDGLEDDDGIEDLSSDLLTAAGASAEVPIVGEALGPLLAIGAGLATIFTADEHEPKPPTLNPSYQML